MAAIRASPSERFVAIGITCLFLVLENDVSYMELALLFGLLHTHHAAMKRFQTNPKRLGYSQGMNDTWNVAQYSEKDVDQEVGIAATFEEHAKRWQ